MPWFQKLCRSAGLTLHHAMQPVKDADTNRQTLKKTVEEEKLSDTVTLRRTTIEEVEVRKSPPAPPDAPTDPHL